MTHLIASAVKRPAVTIGLFAVLAVACAFQLPRLVTDNSLERWLEGDAESLATYHDFLDRFGRDEFLAVSLVAEDPLTPGVLGDVDELTRTIEAETGVRGVFSLSVLAHDMPGSHWPPTAEDRQRLGRFARESNLGRGLLLARSGHGTAILVRIDPELIARDRLVHRLERIVEQTPLSDAVTASYLVGPPVINVALDAASREGLRQFMPLIILVVLIVTWWLLGSPWLVAACLIPSLTSVLLVYGLFVTAGLRQDMITSILAPLVFILTTSGAIHAVSHHRRRLVEGFRGEEALIRSLQEISRPLLFINLTTGVGLAALLASSITQIRTLGCMAAVGVGMGHFVELLLGGAILAVSRARIELRFSPRDRSERLVDGLLVLQRRLGVPAIVAGSLVMIGGLLVAPRLRVESRMLEHFPDDAPVKVATRHFNQEYAGLAPLEVVIDFRREIDPADPAVLATIAEVERSLAATGWLGRTLSVASLREDLARVTREDQSLGSLSPDLAWRLMLRQGPAWFQDVLSSYVSGTKARISGLSRELSSTVLAARFDSLQAGLAEQFPGLDVQLTGFVKILVDMQHRLIESQLRSFALALVFVAGLFVILFRSVKFMALAMVPNLLPLAAAGLLLFEWGEPLNVATIMIASIAMGIAVDNTIHFCVAYQDERARGRSRREAATDATRTAGRAITTATAVISLGFLSLLFASFRMIALFGFLVSLVMVVAWVSAMLILPAVLRCGAGVPDEPRSREAELCSGEVR